MNATQREFVIIGAGPAGLGAGIALGTRATVLERNTDAGGLCRTISLDGAVFDLGGHSFHTPHPEVRQLVFETLPMEVQERQAWCYVNGEMIAYPFQKNFDQLSDPAIVAECQSGLQRIGSEPATSLDQHLELQYGAGIAQHFLRPYNEKLWGPDLSRLTVDWTAERIVGLHNAPKHFSAQGGARTPLQANTQVAYPAQGGYGEIFRALAAKLPQLRFDESVIRIDTDKHILSTAKGECLPWHRIISTLPLPALLKLLPNVPAPLLRRSNQLVALPLNLVLLSLNNQLDTRIQRVYCAGKEMPGHKIVLNHNSSTYLNRLPQHGIMVEVSAHHGSKPVPEKQLCEQIVSGLLKIRLLQGREQINNMRVIALAYGYPVPTHGRAEVVADIKQWLAGQGIYSVGRFGEWAYINADEALYRGLRLGAELAQAT